MKSSKYLMLFTLFLLIVLVTTGCNKEKLIELDVFSESKETGILKDGQFCATTIEHKYKSGRIETEDHTAECIFTKEYTFADGILTISDGGNDSDIYHFKSDNGSTELVGRFNKVGITFGRSIENPGGEYREESGTYPYIEFDENNNYTLYYE